MVTESLKNNLKYFLTKYIKSVLWGVAVRLSYKQDAWCLKVKGRPENVTYLCKVCDYVAHQ